MTIYKSKGLPPAVNQLGNDNDSDDYYDDDGDGAVNNG